MARKHARPPTRVKVENGPVTIEVEAPGGTKRLLGLAMAAYREAAATPPRTLLEPSPGTTAGQAELAGYQPLGFSADMP